MLSTFFAAAPPNAAGPQTADPPPSGGAHALSDALHNIQWQQVVLEYGLPALGAIVLLVIGWFFSAWLGSIVTAALRRARVEETFARFLGKLLRWTVIAFVVLGCVGLFGVDVTSFAAVIAAAGFAIGLAFQGTLSSFSAGVMLLVFRPFKVGDVINVNSQTGKVFEIDLFTTSLDTFDNRRIIIPNSSVFGNTIENITYHPIRRIDLTIGSHYDNDIDSVRATLHRAIAGTPELLKDPAPVVLLSGFGASSIDWIVQAWVKSGDFGRGKDALLRAIKYCFDEDGHSIPYPQMDVHLVAPDQSSESPDSPG